MSNQNAHRRVVALAAATLASALAATTVAGPAQARSDDTESMAPTTTVEPYLRPVAPGVSIRAHLTVDDLPAQNGYRMVGIPDGSAPSIRDRASLPS